MSTCRAMVVHAEMGDLFELGQPGLQSKLKDSQDYRETCLEKPKNNMYQLITMYYLNGLVIVKYLCVLLVNWLVNFFGFVCLFYFFLDRVSLSLELVL